MNGVEFFPPGVDFIKVSGVETLVRFARYQPDQPGNFLEGLELASDLQAGGGMRLYTRGTQITREKIARLLAFRESNPSVELVFEIQRSLKLIQTFQREIQENINSMLRRNQAVREHRELLKGINFNLDNFICELLSDEKITLAIYDMHYLAESSSNGKSLNFFNQALNVALFSLAIASSVRYSSIFQREKSKFTDLARVALFHNYGSLKEIDGILEALPEEQPKKYWTANHKGYFILGTIDFGFEILDSIRLLCEYHLGRKDFINRSRWPDIMANIVLVAEIFLERQSGLFEEPVPVRRIVDEFNLRAVDKDLDEAAVTCLTIGLNLQDIFDFYHEMDRLIKECHYDSACPYPLTGFKSPSIFICRKTVQECQYLESSRTAVTLVRNFGELNAGSYRRCKLLTPQLLAFYDRHYEAIKESTLEDRKLSD